MEASASMFCKGVCEFFLIRHHAKQHLFLWSKKLVVDEKVSSCRMLVEVSHFDESTKELLTGQMEIWLWH